MSFKKGIKQLMAQSTIKVLQRYYWPKTNNPITTKELDSFCTERAMWSRKISSYERSAFVSGANEVPDLKMCTCSVKWDSPRFHKWPPGKFGNNARPRQIHFQVALAHIESGCLVCSHDSTKYNNRKLFKSKDRCFTWLVAQWILYSMNTASI